MWNHTQPAGSWHCWPFMRWTVRDVIHKHEFPSASVARTLSHCAHNPKWWIKFATWYQMQLCLGACLIISTAYFQNKVKSMCPLMWKNMADLTQGWWVQIKARTQVSPHLRLHDLCIPTFSNHYITYIFRSWVRHVVGHFMANSCLCCTPSSDVRTPWY